MRHPLLQWLVYGHLWFALCMVAQVWWVGLFMADAPDLWRYEVAVGSGTVAAYGLMRWVRSRELALRSSHHLKWFSDRYGLMLMICLACAAIAVFFAWPLAWSKLRWLIPAGMMAGSYVTPFTGTDGQAIGLRRIPLMKSVVIALVIALVAVAVPMEYDESGHSPLAIVLVVCMRIPLYLSLAIAFDIRDMRYDPPALRTVPHLFGLRGARMVALLLLAFSAAVEHVFLRGLDQVPSSWLILAGYAVAAVLLVRASPDREEPYFLVGIDGIMILLPVCVWVGTFL